MAAIVIDLAFQQWMVLVEDERQIEGTVFPDNGDHINDGAIPIGVPTILGRHTTEGPMPSQAAGVTPTGGATSNALAQSTDY